MSTAPPHLEGSALVTGASRGIGHGVALALADRGLEVVATMRTPPPPVGPGAGDDELTAGCIVQRLDVRRPEDLVVPEDLRVLVSNAGVDPPNRSVETTPASAWQEAMATNVLGLVEVTRRCLPTLRDNAGGVIVLLTSASLPVPMPFFAAYRATKAAVAAFGESLAAEVAPFGIQVIEVLPGPVDTDMLAASRQLPEEAAAGPYAELAGHVAALRAAMDGPPTPVAEVAAVIADAVVEGLGPDVVGYRRLGPDPVGAAIVEAADAQPVGERLAAYLSAFRLP